MSKLHRVYGPPGCGKTTYLTRQAERAAGTFGRKGVIVASLTRAAASEAAGRVDLDREQVGTLHAHAFRALDRPALAETKPIVDEWNRQAPAGWKSRQRNVQEDLISPMGDAGDDTIYAEYGRLRALCRGRELWPTRVQAFAARWEEFKRETNSMDFADLIENAAKLEHAPGKPAVILLDEAQDFSALEMRLAHKWADTCDQVVIVGDPDQCLYRWRGSDPTVFGNDEAASERTLSQSYRVPIAVHGAAVRWIERIPDRKPIEYLPTDVPGYVQRCPYNSDIDKIVGLIDQIRDNPGTSMFLAPCDYQLTPLIMELRKRGELFHNPYRVTNGKWNPMGPARRVLALRTWRAPEDGGEARPWSAKEVWAWLEPMTAKGLLQRGVKEYVEQLAKRTAFGKSEGDREFPGSALDGIFLSRDSLRSAMDGDLDWYRTHLNASFAKRFEYPLRVSDRYGVAKLREQPRIIVGTIHSVKGGEADDVWLVPDLSQAGWEQGWSRPGEGRNSVRRLFYVGMTRARRGLHLCDPQSSRAVPWKGLLKNPYVAV